MAIGLTPSTWVDLGILAETSAIPSGLIVAGRVAPAAGRAARVAPAAGRVTPAPVLAALGAVLAALGAVLAAPGAVRWRRDGRARAAKRDTRWAETTAALRGQ